MLHQKYSLNAKESKRRGIEEQKETWDIKKFKTADIIYHNINNVECEWIEQANQKIKIVRLD